MKKDIKTGLYLRGICALTIAATLILGGCGSSKEAASYAGTDTEISVNDQAAAQQDTGAQTADTAESSVTDESGDKAGGSDASTDAKASDDALEADTAKQKEIADSMSTEDNALALEFDWFVDKMYDVTKGELPNAIDPEYVRRIEGNEALLLNGGWKCFICDTDVSKPGSGDQYLNAVIDTDGVSFKITLNWWILEDDDANKHNESDVCKGKWDSDKGSVHTAGSIGNIEFTDFYISHEDDAEYAAGKARWSTGEEQYIGLMRMTPERKAEYDASLTAVSDMIDTVTILVDRALEKTGAPEYEIQWNDDGTLTIHLFEIVDDGDGESHTATWDWYTIDPGTMKGTDFMGEEIDLSK